MFGVAKLLASQYDIVGGTGIHEMVLVAVLILVDNSGTVRVEALEFFTRIKGAIKCSAGTQITQFHTHYRATTSYFNMLPLKNAAGLPFKFDRETFFQITRTYHFNTPFSAIAQSLAWLAIVLTPRHLFLLPGP